MKEINRKWVANALGIVVLILSGWMSACSEQDWSHNFSSPTRLSRQGLSGKALPIWATQDELVLQKRIGPPDTSLSRVPPVPGYRVPAEFEPDQAVLMTWTGYEDMLSQIAVDVAQAGAEVWMIGGPPSISGVPVGQYKVLDFAFDSVWSRDYGPVGIYENSSALGIVDPTYRHYASRPDDDAVPCQVAQEIGAACYTTSLILDGGNYMTDGQGNVFVTERIYDWNYNLSQAQVNQLLLDYFGAQTLHLFNYATDSWGEPADGTGHIDMFAKLLGNCKVLVAQSSEAPFSEPLDAAASYFANLECGGSGQYYQVFRVNGWTSAGTWYTYTNSLFVNQTIIIPGYADGNDQEAQNIYLSALPGYNVQIINSDDSIWSGGSIHCIAKEIPAALAESCQSAQDCHLPNVNQHDCVSGHCTIVSCNEGWKNCNSQAADGCEVALSTITDCGDCADACSYTHASAVCQAGVCAMGACDAGYSDCNANDGCETLLGTTTNCGSCGDVCSYAHANSVCQAGVCHMNGCRTGYGDCNTDDTDGCETSLGTVSNCSSCRDECTFPNAGSACVNRQCRLGECNIGFGNCNGNQEDGCEESLGTVANCASCGDACLYENAEGLCQDGACSMGLCDSGTADCDGSLENGCETLIDTAENCSGCGDACVYANAEGLCLDGVCQMGLCDSGYADCDKSVENGCETSIGTFQNCASCGDVCVFDNADGLCDNGQCRMSHCRTGYLDCNLDSGDGCEAMVGTPENCAGCGDICSFDHAAGLCENSSCRMGSCLADYGDCDNNSANGCEIELSGEQNCGACGMACQSGQVCRLFDDGFQCDGGGGEGCDCNSAGGTSGSGWLVLFVILIPVRRMQISRSLVKITRPQGT